VWVVAVTLKNGIRQCFEFGIRWATADVRMLVAAIEERDGTDY